MVGTPGHPNFHGIFHEINHPAIGAKLGVPLNHPFSIEMGFSMKQTIQDLGYPLFWKPPYGNPCPRTNFRLSPACWRAARQETSSALAAVVAGPPGFKDQTKISWRGHFQNTRKRLC